MKQERRNGHAFHPIMSKGGVHEKTEKAKRKAAKHEMKRKVSEWLDVKGGSSATRSQARSRLNNIKRAAQSARQSHCTK